jgi:hypothetical protein
MSVLDILSIRQRIATFLFARDTLKLQTTCKTFLNWRAPYFLENYHSKCDILRLARMCSSLTINHVVVSAEMRTMEAMVSFASQTPLQLCIVDFYDYYFPLSSVFKQFLSTCVSETTQLNLEIMGFEQMFSEILSFPHLKNIVVPWQHLILNMNRDIDSRVHVSSVAIEYFSKPDSAVTTVGFFLQRLVGNFPLVQFSEGQLFRMVTSKEIVDFCELVVWKFAGSRFFVLIDMNVTLSDVANKEIVAVALNNMMKSDIRWACGLRRSRFIIHHSTRSEIVMAFGHMSFTGSSQK